MDDALKQINKVKCELKTLVLRLEKQYFSPNTPGFPASDELKLVNTLIVQLGAAIGKKRFGPTHFWGVVKALDRRYTKLGIKDFFNKLVDRLVSLPQGPLTRIKKRLEAGDAPDKKQLGELAKLIEKYDSGQDCTKVDWATLYPVILPFTTGAFQTLAKNSMGGYSFEHDFQTQAFNNAFGHAAFADVLVQRLAWRLKYGTVFNEIAAPVYILLNPEYDQRLRDAFYGDPPTPEHMKEANESAMTRERQRRRRAKKRD